MLADKYIVYQGTLLTPLKLFHLCLYFRPSFPFTRYFPINTYDDDSATIILKLGKWVEKLLAASHPETTKFAIKSPPDLQLESHALRNEKADMKREQCRI
jgi:hypothetical protein